MSAPKTGGAGSSPLLLVLSLLVVYLVWGSTYLVIRFALAGYPPMFFPGLRFFCAGILLFAVMRLRGAPLPTLRQWRNAIAVGFLLLDVGNGAVVFAEQSVGSGLAATAVATVPLWAALAGGFWGAWPGRLQWLGMAIGFIGIVILNFGGDFAANPIAAGLLVLSSVTWAVGSVWSRRLDLPKGSMSTACQMCAAGAIFLAFSAARGESWHLMAPPKAMAAVAYLSLVGSLLAFSAYMYLVQNVSPALATSNSYVNPVVAVLLGMCFGAETFTTLDEAATILVLVGVVLIVAFNRTMAPVPEAPRPAVPEP